MQIGLDILPGSPTLLRQGLHDRVAAGHQQRAALGDGDDLDPDRKLNGVEPTAWLAGLPATA